jgi:hypothetical protein
LFFGKKFSFTVAESLDWKYKTERRLLRFALLDAKHRLSKVTTMGTRKTWIERIYADFGLRLRRSSFQFKLYKW